MSPSQETLLTAAGWSVDCESPFELSHPDGSRATGAAARLVLGALEEESRQEPRGHAAYIADMDEDQLNSLVQLAAKKLEDLRNGGWEVLWVVGDYANQGWFANDDYAKAVEFMGLLMQKHVAEGKRYEMNLEPSRYRPTEAQRLIADTEKELLILRKAAA